ncbi:MAG: 1,4-alpha-glucan branching protein GlgB [Oscillospiraceae bacterium]|nr:1,4-alpha-glucan branching protein GlgB [Oscillospiraceae bacterium]
MGNTFFSEAEQRTFHEGKLYECYRKFGVHRAVIAGQAGFRFCVWAPEVKSVSLVGTFNDWQVGAHVMRTRGASGVWQLFVPEAAPGDLYKYVIQTQSGELEYRADPFAAYAELPPGTASRIYLGDFRWTDEAWLRSRKSRDHYRRPMNIYEVHAGSWHRHDKQSGGGYLTYRELAETLVPYAADMGYTHIELMPIMEHPFDGSWGYQITGYYAPTARYGAPDDFRYFIDSCHHAGLGVILDWVPGHFCRDEHGLGRWGGGKLFEINDQPQWGTYKFDLGRPEVRAFLIGNACYWISQFHADGLRVDGVSSMLYMNFGIDDPAQKRYNPDGTEGDLNAITFLQELNHEIGCNFPGVITIAEESTAWPLVTYPPESGGLGFHYKWDMGWMNDTLHYMQADFPYRPYNHKLLTFSMMYNYNENFVLPLSHDEVVHGKSSLIQRMPGDYWRQFAGLRALYLYQMTHPGAKLNFMGNEIGQFVEWRYDESIEWFLTGYESHRRYLEFTKSMNRLFLKEKALWEDNFQPDGFTWIDADNAEQGIVIYRRGAQGEEVLVLINFQPDTYDDFRVGVPDEGAYRELLSSDSAEYGGSGRINYGVIKSEPIPWQGMPHSIRLIVPPLGGLILKRTGKPTRQERN